MKPGPLELAHITRSPKGSGFCLGVFSRGVDPINISFSAPSPPFMTKEKLLGTHVRPELDFHLWQVMKQEITFDALIPFFVQPAKMTHCNSHSNDPRKWAFVTLHTLVSIQLCKIHEARSHRSARPSIGFHRDQSRIPPTKQRKVLCQEKLPPEWSSSTFHYPKCGPSWTWLELFVARQKPGPRSASK